MLNHDPADLMPLYFSSNIRAVPTHPLFRFKADRTGEQRLVRRIEDAFAQGAHVRVLPEGPTESGLLPDGVEDPRRLIIDEPDVLAYVEDDACGGAGYFVGFDRVPHPMEIPERQYIWVHRTGVGFPFPAVVFWRAMMASVGDEPGQAPAFLPAGKWREFLTLGVGEVFYWGENAAPGAVPTGALKRVRDDPRAALDEDATFSLPSEPKELHTLDELWWGYLLGTLPVSEDFPWHAVTRLAPGERYDVHDEDGAETGEWLVERVS
jgi:hypothetical protein